MARFDDKIVLVTGGSRGIGRACAERFAQEGAAVALCARTEEAAANAAKEIAEATGATVEGYQADISDSESVDALIASVTQDFGGLHVLVNNAGITKDGLLMRMKNDDWNAVIQTNLNGTFYCCRAVTRGMIKQRYGRIVNLSSIVGARGQAGQSNYAAAKAGIIGFTKALAQELASRNITANVVAPGFVATDMTAALGEKALEEMTKRIPAARPGTPEEVAAAVAYLASDEAAYITGHTLNIDGGLGM